MTIAQLALSHFKGQLLKTRSLLLAPKIDSINVKSLKCISQNATDVFEESKQNSCNTFLIKEKLQELVNQNKTLNEIATELSISVSKVRQLLDKNGIRNTNLEELAVLRKYFSATTPKEKAEAFAAVDKYLIKIAKDKYDPSCMISYEDCLQDVRLNFAELANIKKEHRLYKTRNIFKILGETETIKKEEVKTVGITQEIDEIGDLDLNIKDFEESDFFDKYILKSLHLFPRQEAIFNDYIKGSKNFEQLAEDFCLTTQRVQELFNKVINRFKKLSSRLEINTTTMTEGTNNEAQDLIKQKREDLLEFKDSLFYLLLK